MHLDAPFDCTSLARTSISYQYPHFATEQTPICISPPIFSTFSSTSQGTSTRLAIPNVSVVHLARWNLQQRTPLTFIQVWWTWSSVIFFVIGFFRFFVRERQITGFSKKYVDSYPFRYAVTLLIQKFNSAFISRCSLQWKRKTNNGDIVSLYLVAVGWKS